LVPTVAANVIILNLGEQIAPWHHFHDQQALLGLNAGTQERNNVGMAASLQYHYLLDESLMLGWRGAADNFNGHICGTMQQSQKYRAGPSCTPH